MFSDRQTTLVELKPVIPEKPVQEQPFNKKLVLRGTMWFALLTIVSVAVVFFYSHTGDTVSALSGIRVKYNLVCFAMVFIDLMLGSWRNHIFIRKLKPGLSHWVSFKANVSNMFMGAVTPFHSGAGPAQLYVYNRHGLPVHDGFIVSLINMGATLLFMPLAGLFAIWAMKDQLDSGLIPVLLRYGFAVFSIFLSGFLMAFWRPLWIGALLKRIISRIGNYWPSKRRGLDAWADSAYANILKHQQISKKLLKDHPLLFPVSLLVTALLYLNKYCMQYVILLGLGIQTRLMDVISIQVLIQFMIYFAPSPGGSGFAEAGIAVLFSRLVPQSILPVFTLLQRSFLLFFPAMAGAFFVIRLVRAHASGKAVRNKY
jgi:uncharacterized protein (TIRG00374 family)